MISKGTLKLIAVVVGAVALTSVMCYVIFVLMPDETACALAGRHYLCQKLSEGVYRCVVQ
jgi:hypothetical protein